MVYEYNVHIYISHFFFIRDKVECHYTLLSHFYVVLVCRRAEWHFTVQIMVWSHCKWGTQGLSVYHLLIIGALDLSRGFVSCVCCAAVVIFLRDVRWGATIKGIASLCFVLHWGGWNIVLRQVGSKFTGFWLCVSVFETWYE